MWNFMENPNPSSVIGNKQTGNKVGSLYTTRMILPAEVAPDYWSVSTAGARLDYYTAPAAETF